MKVALAFMTKDRLVLTRQSIEPLLNLPVDLFICDGSATEAGRKFPHEISLEQAEHHKIYVHGAVVGGADPAIAYALTAMLKGSDYTHVGLIENDVLLDDGWFEPTMGLFERGEAEGLKVGAVSARCYEDRILCQRDGYALMHNLGFGMQIMTRDAARLALAHMRTGWTVDNRRLFCQLSGLDIGSWWAFRANDQQVCADWNQDRLLASFGYASLALTPSPCQMIGQEPSLADQGLTLAKAPVEILRNDDAFDRFVQRTAALQHDLFVTNANTAVYHDDAGGSIYMPHQVGLLEGAAYKGDWKLKWTQGFGPFSWRAGQAGDTFEATLSGPAEFHVSGGQKGGQAILEDLKSGYSVKPILPPNDQAMSLIAPCGVSHRPLRLTLTQPGMVFYAVRTKERQPEMTGWAFSHDLLPPVA